MSLITDSAGSGSAADVVVESLTDLYLQIRSLPHLRPSPEMDQLFTELVRLIVDTPDSVARTVLEHVDVRTIANDLRGLASRAEVELELAWAHRIAESDEPDAELRRFPYLANYRKLCRVERGLIDAAVDHKPRSVAFLGCGALPVTSLMLTGDLGCEVVNIDRDQAALDAAAGMVQALGSPGVGFAMADATTVELSGFDVVVLAALIGTTDADKRAVLSRLRRSMRRDAVLLARGARGLRTLLYPPIQDEALTGFDVRAVVHPVSEVINSVVLARPVG